MNMNGTQLTLSELESNSLTNDDSPEVPPSDIVAYNELRSCADLYRMYKQKILNINPEFQRDFVWNGSDQTRFIDSLIKQLPIPSMCFALDNKLQKWIVIDGLQRISTIIKFLKGEDWTLAKLDDIDQGLAGESASSIKDEENTKLHGYYTRVENLAIPVTMLRCDFNKKSHMEYLFTIFHRLNTGGMKLNNQEIRNCIYSGSLNSLLKELDKNPDWRYLNKMKKEENYRFTKQEIILRFFAFYDEHLNYTGRLATFLNAYMHSNQNNSEMYLDNKKKIFNETVKFLYERLFEKSPPKKLSLTILESLLLGVSKNIDLLRNKSNHQLKALYEQLLSEEEFSEASLVEGLAQKKKVIDRLNKAIAVFGS
jgi:hypothetical protein